MDLAPSGLGLAFHSPRQNDLVYALLRLHFSVPKMRQYRQQSDSVINHLLFLKQP